VIGRDDDVFLSAQGVNGFEIKTDESPKANVTDEETEQVVNRFSGKPDAEGTR
jgi:hypothetical protein